MKTIDIVVSHPHQKYSVTIGLGLLSKVNDIIDVNKYSSFYLISDSNVSKHYLPIIKRILQEKSSKSVNSYVFESGEKNKQLQTVELIWNDMAKNMIDRKVLVLAIGGGVVTDVAGFVASTYQRGVDFVYIPTTLEGMVDASVGGKTGINLGHLKNYIGTFCQPKAVLIDTDTLKTLPPRVLLQGYSEAVKHGLIADSRYFELSTQKSPLKMSTGELIEIIICSVKIKSRIIQEDEKELGIRKVLNFGHTVGHALESLSMKTDDPLFHGEAVAIGMIAEAKISEQLGMITEYEFEKIEDALTRVGLPTQFTQQVSRDQIADMLITDKKNIGGKIKWTLLTKIGEADFNIEIGEKFARCGIDYICP